MLRKLVVIFMVFSLTVLTDYGQDLESNRTGASDLCVVSDHGKTVSYDFMKVIQEETNNEEFYETLLSSSFETLPSVFSYDLTSIKFNNKKINYYQISFNFPLIRGLSLRGPPIS